MNFNILSFVIWISLVIMILSIPVFSVSMWISNMYSNATIKFNMATAAYFSHDLKTGDHYMAEGNARLAEADQWAKRFHIFSLIRKA